MKAPSYIMRHRKLMMKVQQLIMNTNCKNEGAIADNESIKVIILQLFYKQLLISCEAKSLSGHTIDPFQKGRGTRQIFLVVTLIRYYAKTLADLGTNKVEEIGRAHV